MNKKILNIFVMMLVILLLGNIAVSGFSKEKYESLNFKIDFSKPITKDIILEETTFININMDGTNAILSHENKPLLPFYRYTITLPFGTKINNIECETSEINSIILSSKIAPASKPVIMSEPNPVLNYELDEIIYNSDELYPEKWVRYYTGGGLDEDNEHKTFLTIFAFPVRYNPLDDEIFYVENIEIKIDYREPTKQLLNGNNDYDMVIIAPSYFSSNLQKLINHKNSNGVNTILKTTEEIYNEYDGVDKPEQIKYFIKDAIETWDIKYVLLVGGLNSIIDAIPRDDKNQGSKDWHIPVRYTNLILDSSNYDEPGFISDLYFADIFDSEGGFCSWNSNNDGTFAKWGRLITTIDKLDLYPDVYVGRLPCRYKFEVKIMVDKIIEYETETSEQDWFDKIIVVGGDNHRGGVNEGEITCEEIIVTMNGFDPIRLYVSNVDLNPEFVPEPDNIISELSKGCGFLYFCGHAYPGGWSTKYIGSTIKTEMFHWSHLPSLKNNEKYPICVMQSCHPGQFNVSYLRTIQDTDNSKYMNTYGTPVPECFSWWLTRKINGGSIATISSTGTDFTKMSPDGDYDGDGIEEPNCIEAYGGYLSIQFFKTYDEGKDILGECWSGTIKKYLDTFPGMDNIYDAKHVEQLVLIGDPSLKIGGY